MLRRMSWREATCFKVTKIAQIITFVLSCQDPWVKALRLLIHQVHLQLHTSKLAAACDEFKFITTSAKYYILMRDYCSWHLCSSLHTYARRSWGSYLDDSEIFMMMHVGGLMFHSGQSNMQYVTTATFLLTTYAKYLSAARATVNCGGRTVTPSQLSSVAIRQVNITSYITPTMIWERNYLLQLERTTATCKFDSTV